MTPCPCGSGASYTTCCEPRHTGTAPAETPEALMRSRYSAFALHLGQYLVETHDTQHPPNAARALTEWSKSVHWLGLTVHSATQDGERGTVAFTARTLEGVSLVALSETSRFSKAKGRWQYLDGEPRTERTRLSRNSPCPCGSGQKLKQCHG